MDLETPATVAIESTGYPLWFHALLTRLLQDKVDAAGKANCASPAALLTLLVDSGRACFVCGAPRTVGRYLSPQQ